MIAIDLGSNTFRAVNIDCETFERIWEFEKVVRTAEGLNKTSMICEDALSRILQAIEELKSTHDFKPEEVIAVTTEAIRRAENSTEILNTIKEQSGIKFTVINGEDEAYFTTIAVRESLKKVTECKSFVLIDIGGGSTEVIFYEKEQIVSKSFPLGIVTMTEKYDSKELVSFNLPHECESIKEFIADMRAHGFKPKQFIATAGTPTTIAAVKQGMNYKNYQYEKVNGHILEKTDLDIELSKLLRLPFKEREGLVGTGRADLIITGILIYKELYKLLGFRECMVIDDGLREGVALAKCRGLI